MRLKIPKSMKCGITRTAAAKQIKVAPLIQNIFLIPESLAPHYSWESDRKASLLKHGFTENDSDLGFMQ